MALTNLNRKLNDMDKMRRGGRAPLRKKLLARLVILGLVLFVTLYLPIRGVYLSAKQLNLAAKQISLGAKQNNLEQIKKGVDDTQNAVSGLNTSLNFLFWLRIIPFAGNYYADAKHFTVASSYEIKAIKKIVELLDPVKDEVGLSGQAVPGQDKVAQALKILDKLVPSLDKIEPDLKNAALEVSSVDTGKYPESFGSHPLKIQIETAKNFMLGASSLVTDNRQVLEVMPSMLGNSSPKSYLLLFQNDKEIRPTGGFLTAYAFLKLDNGHIAPTVSDDIYRLDEQLLNTCLNKICPLRPPAPIVKYLPEADGRLRTTWSMRDSNLSPDLPTSMQEFERMYKLLNNAQSFDGIITIDTKVVEDLIKVTGPIEIYGTKYSADTDPRCNCPNVVFELERYAQVIEKGEADRKAVLGILMQQLLARALGASTEKVPEFISVGATLANTKHIMLYLHDPKAETAFDKLNWTGRITASPTDYLHINDANFAGGKSNLYVEKKVSLEVKVDSSSETKHTLTIEYKNPQPYNTWLNNINRNYVRVYVPKGAKLISGKGSDPDTPIIAQDDDILNKTYFEAFISIRPQNSRTLVFEYTTPNTTSYHLLIQKQPGAKDYHYSFKLNGQTKADQILSQDQSL